MNQISILKLIPVNNFLLRKHRLMFTIIYEHYLRNILGSLFAICRSVKSSSVTYSRPIFSSSASFCSMVVLPTCRGPVSSSAGNSLDRRRKVSSIALRIYLMIITHSFPETGELCRFRRRRNPALIFRGKVLLSILAIFGHITFLF